MANATENHYHPDTGQTGATPGPRLIKGMDLAGRLGLSALFLLTGIGKISSFAMTQDYMASQGVPGGLLYAVIIAEIGGALALITGFLVRPAALGLAAFSVISGLVFHSDLGDQTHYIQFLKNIAIAGGLLLVAAHSPATIKTPPGH